jgi:uncharacterized protein
LLAFIRITTSLKVYGTMVASVDEAWGQVTQWLGCENVWIPEPTARHAQFLSATLRFAGAGGKLVPDAHLAALAMDHGLTLCSSDRDFARFQGLRWVDPIQ